MSLFRFLIETLGRFNPDEPLITEALLEAKLKDYLKPIVTTTSQVSKKENRYDLVCRLNDELVCIELKIKAESSDFAQFDRYLKEFRDGLIIVCWQATFSVREVFAAVKEQSPIPIEMVELSKRFAY